VGAAAKASVRRKALDGLDWYLAGDEPPQVKRDGSGLWQPCFLFRGRENWLARLPEGDDNKPPVKDILPGAVFGPILAAENLGSVQIIQGLLQGRPAAVPRLGFWVVDVRYLADLHIRAMTSPESAGQRVIAAGDFMWMEEIAQTCDRN